MSLVYIFVTLYVFFNKNHKDETTFLFLLPYNVYPTIKNLKP